MCCTHRSTQGIQIEYGISLIHVNKHKIVTYVDIYPQCNNEHMRETCELINEHMRKLLVG